MILHSLKLAFVAALVQRLFDYTPTNGFVAKLGGKRSQRLRRGAPISKSKEQLFKIALASSVGNKRSNGRDSNSEETAGTPITERLPPSPSDFVRNPTDFSVAVDHNGIPITIDRLLATKPLQGDCQTRPGPGGRELTYMSGDAVTRNLNMIFGYNQWSLHIIKSEKSVCIEVENPRASGSKLWHVSYSAHVRITHLPSGSYREDIGCGDVIDRSLVVADQNAVKASITDAMKRAARHFGDKLGNSLYDSEFNMRNAPKSLREALDLFDREQNL